MDSGSIDFDSTNAGAVERDEQLAGFQSGYLKQKSFGGSSCGSMDGEIEGISTKEVVTPSEAIDLEQEWTAQDKAFFKLQRGTSPGRSTASNLFNRSEYMPSSTEAEPEVSGSIDDEFIDEPILDDSGSDVSDPIGDEYIDEQILEEHRVAVEKADRLAQNKEPIDWALQPANRLMHFYKTRPKAGDVALYAENPNSLKLQHPDLGSLVAIGENFGDEIEKKVGGVFGYYRPSTKSPSPESFILNKSGKLFLSPIEYVLPCKLPAYYFEEVREETDSKRTMAKDHVPLQIPAWGNLVGLRKFVNEDGDEDKFKVHAYYRKPQENLSSDPEIDDVESVSDSASENSISSVDSGLNWATASANVETRLGSQITPPKITVQVDSSTPVSSGTNFVNRLSSFSKVLGKTVVRAAIFSVILPFVAAKTMALAGVRILDLSFKDIRNLISDEPMIKRAMGPTYMKMRSGDFKSKLLAKTFRLMDAAILPGVVTVQPWVLAISLVPTFFYAVLDSAHYSVQLSNMANKQFKALTAKKSDNLDLEAAGKKFA